jgi:16S rRNA (guanine(527)-N(7))-methyltransferase RsmG
LAGNVFRESLASEFAPFATLSHAHLTSFEQHYQLLERWNKSINLTRIRSLSDAVRFHYCESLFAGLALPTDPLRIADVGSGAGFPGIPIAILRPDCYVELIESHQRKAVFLKEASRSLPNVTVNPSRADSAVGEWDWVVSRAVSLQEVLSLGLAPNVAVLTTKEELGSFVPNKILAVPWGNQRVLAMFHVEQLESRDKGT